jgi:hypothetical protein
MERIGGGRGGATCEAIFLVMRLNDYQQAGSSTTLNEGECKPVAHRVLDEGAQWQMTLLNLPNGY